MTSALDHSVLRHCAALGSKQSGYKCRAVTKSETVNVLSVCHIRAFVVKTVSLFFHLVSFHLSVSFPLCLFPGMSPTRTDCQSLSPSPHQTSPLSALSEPRLLAGTHSHTVTMCPHDVYVLCVFYFSYMAHVRKINNV